MAFDTIDLEFGATWWYEFYGPKSNDLTNKTLIIVLTISQGHVVWDECNEGDAPKRSRNYRCFGYNNHLKHQTALRHERKNESRTNHKSPNKAISHGRQKTPFVRRYVFAAGELRC
jgi:hypothetical protein